MARPHSLSRALVTGLVFSVLVTAGATTAYTVLTQRERLVVECWELREDCIAERRDQLRDETRRAIDYVRYRREAVEHESRQTCRQRTREFCASAQRVYERLHYGNTDAEIAAVLAEALEAMRFAQGTGYFFVAQMDGTIVLSPTRPGTEGGAGPHVDADATRESVDRQIDLVRRDGEGFDTFSVARVDTSKALCPKATYVMHFEPLDWVVGAAVCLDDMDALTQAEVLDYIDQTRFGVDGYIFAGQYDGLSLSGPAQGKNMLDVEDTNGVKIVQELIAQALAGGGYVNYVMPPFEGTRAASKLSYVEPIEDWGWYIGAGVYIDDIEVTIAERETQLRSEMRGQMYANVVVAAIASTVLIAAGLFFSRRIRREVVTFRGFFSKAASGPARMDVLSLAFEEFRELGAYANEALTRREEAKESLKDSEARFRSVLDTMPEALVVVQDNVVVFGNHALGILVGCHENQPISSVLIARVDPPHQAMVEAAISNGIQGSSGGEPLEISLTTADGSSRRWIELRSSTISNAGRPAWLGIAIDITDRKHSEQEKTRLDAQLQRTQQLESLGVLAGGIAHDFNNLMQGVLGNASLVISRLPDDSDCEVLLTRIVDASERASELAQQMLAYSGKGVFSVEPVDLSEIVGQMSHLVESAVSKKVRLVRDLAPDLPTVVTDVTQLRQIVMNLIANGSDALGEAPGTVVMRTYAEEIDRARLARSFVDDNLDAGTYVVIEVSDTGKGMDQQTLARIFEPFYTTKFPGRGLGLSTVLGTVRSHQGAVEVESRLGEGTTFRILLPAKAGLRPARPTPEVTARAEHGNGVVLIVDDEPAVVEVARDVLQSVNYKVMIATNGQEGIEMFGAHADEIDIVLLDMTMPELGGDDVLRHLRRLAPGIPIVLSTGYSEAEASSRFGGERPTAFLSKPYTINKLLLTLEQARDAGIDA